MYKLISLLVFLMLFRVGISFAGRTPVNLLPDDLTVGYSTTGIGFLNLNNPASGQDMVMAYGVHLMCQKDIATRHPNEWIAIEAVTHTSPDINPFPVCVWPKGEYNNKSCATVTYDREYASGNPWPTDDWVDYFALQERCIDGEATYLPLMIK